LNHVHLIFVAKPHEIQLLVVILYGTPCMSM